MIRHYDKRVDFNRIVSPGYFVPPFFNHDSCIIQNHRVINDVSEKANAFLRADSDGIGAILFVVVTAQTNRTTVVMISLARTGVSGFSIHIILSVRTRKKLQDTGRKMRKSGPERGHALPGAGELLDMGTLHHECGWRNRVQYVCHGR